MQRPQTGERGVLRRPMRCAAGCIALLAAAVTCGVGTQTAGAQTAAGPWTASWASAQMRSFSQQVLQASALTGMTLREVAHLSAGGRQLRITVSNDYGDQPLVLTAVHAARPGTDAGSIEPSTDRAVTFSGLRSVSVPPGAVYVSDPVNLPAAALSDVAVTLEVASAPPVLTSHDGSRATSFLLPGNHGGDAALPGAHRVVTWLFLSEIDVSGEPAHGAVVAFGDSITDGDGSTTDANDRWPDALARRLQADPHTRGTAVVNEGIGGNHILTDGIGANALARFGRDVLGIAGVRSVLVLEGINDIGGLDIGAPHPQAAHDELVAKLEAGLRQMIARAHGAGLRIYGGTLTPFVGNAYYHVAAASEADRVALNEWIRHGAGFDGVVDFDAAIRDPAHPDRMAAEYDCGDHLHPGPAGYKKMADAIPLAMLAR